MNHVRVNWKWGIRRRTCGILPKWDCATKPRVDPKGFGATLGLGPNKSSILKGCILTLLPERGCASEASRSSFARRSLRNPMPHYSFGTPCGWSCRHSRACILVRPSKDGISLKEFGDGEPGKS